VLIRDLIQARFAGNQANFAAATSFTYTGRRLVSDPERRTTRTSPALVTRILQGTRSLPTKRIGGWATAFKLTSPAAVASFTEATFLDAALYEVRAHAQRAKRPFLHANAVTKRLRKRLAGVIAEVRRHARLPA
jgi:hypothetical protein